MYYRKTLKMHQYYYRTLYFSEKVLSSYQYRSSAPFLKSEANSRHRHNLEEITDELTVIRKAACAAVVRAR